MSAATLSAPYAGSSERAELDPAVFGEEFHMALVHEAARADLNARRRGTHSTKDRGEVAMTGAKAFRQKGTGRARAGALSTPQRYGGGVAFGPKPRGYTVKVNRKARRRALRCALSVHAGRGSLALHGPRRASRPPPQARRRGPGGAGRGLGPRRGGARRGRARPAFLPQPRAGCGVRGADEVGVADVIGAALLLLTPAALELVSALARPPRGGVEA